MASNKRGEMPPNDFSQPGPSQNTDSQDTHKRDEECKQQNHDQKEANNRNDNKTKKAVNTKKMTYRVVEVNDPAMIAQIQCLKILKSLGAEIPPNVVNFLDLDETRKIFVIEAEDSSNESDQNSTTHDTDQKRSENLMTEREKYDKDEIGKIGGQK